MSASSCYSVRGRPTLTSKAAFDHRRSMPKAQTPESPAASPASRRRRIEILRAVGGRGGSGGGPDYWLERIKQGIPEVEAPDYGSDSAPPSTSSAPRRTPGTTPLGARPRRGAGGSASGFSSSTSSYSSDDEARASVRRQERVLLDAWTGVGDAGGSGKPPLAPSLPVVGGASALLLLALLVAAGPPS